MYTQSTSFTGRQFRPRHPAPSPHVLDGAIEYVTTFFLDPLDSGPYLCMTRLAAACKVLSHEWNTHVTAVSKTRFAKSRPRLLRAAMEFMAYKESAFERTQIVKYLLHCTHGCKSCPMMPLEDPTDAESLNEAYHTLLSVPIILVSQILVKALSELTRNKFRNPKPGVEPYHQPWPTSPEDLCPGGIPDTIKGISFWAEKSYSIGDPVPSVVMLDLAANLASFHRPFARECMRPPYRLGLLQPLVQLHESVLMPSFPQIHIPKMSSLMYENEILPVASVIETLLFCDREAFIEMMVNTKEEVLPIIGRLTTRLAELPASVWGSHIVMLKGLAAMAKATKDTPTGAWIIPTNVTHEFNRAKAVVYNRAFDIRSTFEVMVPVRKGGCWNIACPSTGESGMPKLRLCSQCDLLRYCGKKCQKEAWKHPEYPHKELCTQVRSFKEQLGPEVWASLWVPGFDVSTFTLPPPVKEAADPELAEDIGGNLALLMAAKSNHAKN
ncbi:hypothetical protein MD484_g6906, partial [Candolleomyces efflorescens]